jgi:flagellar motor switch protein FliN/FliY
MALNQGSVVELDRAAGDPLDVFVNGTLVAHGEVVVVNDKFGIRLTDVISPAERVRKLR